MNIPSMEELLRAGAHFGHQASRWHPKMAPYIYTTKNGRHVLDVKKTQEQLQTAGDYLKKVVANGGTILFVGTKSQAQPIIEKYAKEVGMPYVRERWIGGLLTNFKEVKKSITRYVNLLKQKDAGDWKKYTKKEQVGFQKEMEKLEESVSGLVGLDKLPDAVVIVDVRTEKTALQEANVVDIPVVALCDSNVNPRGVKHVIPANDDAAKGIDLLLKSITEAVQEGLKNRKVVAGDEKKARPAPKKSEKPAESKEGKQSKAASTEESTSSTAAKKEENVAA